MSKHRFTIDELHQMSDFEIIRIVVNERLNGFTNPYTPPAQRFKRISNFLDRMVENHVDLQALSTEPMIQFKPLDTNPSGKEVDAAAKEILDDIKNRLPENVYRAFLSSISGHARLQISGMQIAEGTNQVTDAVYVGDAEATDPDTKNVIDLYVYKDPITEGMFALDASWVDQVADGPVKSPFGDHLLNVEED